MSRFCSLAGSSWRPHEHPRSFAREQTTGPERLRVGVPIGSLEPIDLLLPQLGEPLLVLYVLHTPRGGSQAGRYESSPLGQREVKALLGSYRLFLTGDGRHDLWIANREGSQLIWDRHDVLYAHGQLERFAAILLSAGYRPGPVDIPVPHQHSYHPSFDDSERSLLAEYPWRRTDLHPSDEQ